MLKLLAKIQIFGTVFNSPMSFQYTYDAEGRPVGVFVPLNEWEKITDALKKAKEKKRKTSPQKAPSL
ncbi:MAG TPA: hypothetical protein VIM65_20260 [Cyclobacteriaceae bacterium]